MPATAAMQRAKIARVARRAKKDPTALPELERLRAEHAAQRIAEFIEAVVDAAPPLTAAQRDRLATLLRPIPGGAGDVR